MEIYVKQKQAVYTTMLMVCYFGILSCFSTSGLGVLLLLLLLFVQWVMIPVQVLALFKRKDFVIYRTKKKEVVMPEALYEDRCIDCSEPLSPEDDDRCLACESELWDEDNE